MGDFNITFDDADVWDPVGLKDTIHCTEEERDHLRALIALGLTDSVRLFPQPEKNYSWWDYRNMAFRRKQGLRIDHILISDALKPLATRLRHRRGAAQKRAPQRPRAGGAGAAAA